MPTPHWIVGDRAGDQSGERFSGTSRPDRRKPGGASLRKRPTGWPAGRNSRAAGSFELHRSRRSTYPRNVAKEYRGARLLRRVRLEPFDARLKICGPLPRHPSGRPPGIPRLAFEDGLGDPNRQQHVEHVDRRRHYLSRHKRRPGSERLAVPRPETFGIRVVLHGPPIRRRLRRASFAPGWIWTTERRLTSFVGRVLATVRMNGTRGGGAGCACKITHSISRRAAGLGGEYRQARLGATELARKVLRLATLAILFLLALMTGMLLPPSWVLSH